MQSFVDIDRARPNSSLRILAFWLFGLLGCTLGHSQDWGSIRGPRFDGSAMGDVADVGSGPIGLEVVWKQPIGSGYSGVVKSGRFIATAMADVKADKEYVVVMDSETGETIWKQETGKVFPGANGSFDGPIATPAIDDQHVYHLSPFGDLAAYQLSDGKLVWQKNLKDEFSAQPNFYGFGASPIVVDDKLIVPVGGSEGAFVAFDSKSGDVLWGAGDDTVAYQSPILVTLEDKPTLLAAGNTQLFALDPSKGSLLWSAPHGGAGGDAAWAVVPVPLPGNGVFLNDGKNSSTAMSLDGLSATTRWSSRDLRNSYCVPVMAGGLLCSYSSRVLTAVDPQTGKRVWRSRAPSNGFLATVAGRLVVATMEGSVHVGDVTDQGFQEVASAVPFETSESGSDGLMWALPSVAGRSIYLRSLGAVARIDVVPSSSGPEKVARTPQVSPRFQTFLNSLAEADDRQAAVDAFLKDKTLPWIDGKFVHFLVTGDYEDIAVASELFGVRQERPMVHLPDTNLFYYGVELPAAARASYAFFADYQPIVDPRNQRTVVSSTLTGEMEPLFMGPDEPLKFSWFDSADPQAGLSDSPMDAPVEMSGTMEKGEIKSELMKETIAYSVYLPPSYDASSPESSSFPVVFVHDGGPALEAGNQAFIVDDLIQRGEIRETVVVFVERRFYPFLGATGYDKMFAQELLPSIRTSYPISDQRDDVSCIGGGFGATLGLFATLPNSDQVGKYAAHSPFAFEMLQPLISGLAKMPNPRCKVMVQWGEYEYGNPGENWDMAIQAKFIAKTLQDGGHQVTTAPHTNGTDWVCWRKQSPAMWKFLVGKK